MSAFIDMLADAVKWLVGARMVNKRVNALRDGAY